MSQLNPIRVRARLGVDELELKLDTIEERVVVVEEDLGIGPGGGGGGSGLLPRIIALENANILLQQQIEALNIWRGQTDAWQAGTDVWIGNADTTIGGLQTSVGEIQTSVGEIQTSVGEIQTSVGEIQTSVGTIQTQIASLQESTAYLEQSLSILTSEWKPEVDAELVRLDQRQDAFLQWQVDQGVWKAWMQSRVDDIDTWKASTDTTLTLLQSKITDLETWKTSTTTTLTSYNTRITALEQGDVGTLPTRVETLETWRTGTVTPALTSNQASIVTLGNWKIDTVDPGLTSLNQWRTINAEPAIYKANMIIGTGMVGVGIVGASSSQTWTCTWSGAITSAVQTTYGNSDAGLITISWADYGEDVVPVIMRWNDTGSTPQSLSNVDFFTWPIFHMGSTSRTSTRFVIKETSGATFSKVRFWVLLFRAGVTLNIALPS